MEYFLAKIPIYGKYYRRSSEATLSIVVGLVLLLKMVSVCTVLLFCMLNRWFLYSVRLLQILVFMLMQYNPTKLSLQPCAHYVHACLFARIHGAQCGSGYLGRGVEFVYRTVAGRISVTLDACCVLRAPCCLSRARVTPDLAAPEDLRRRRRSALPSRPSPTMAEACFIVEEGMQGLLVCYRDEGAHGPCQMGLGFRQARA